MCAKKNRAWGVCVDMGSKEEGYYSTLLVQVIKQSNIFLIEMVLELRANSSINWSCVTATWYILIPVLEKSNKLTRINIWTTYVTTRSRDNFVQKYEQILLKICHHLIVVYAMHCVLGIKCFHSSPHFFDF